MIGRKLNWQKRFTPLFVPRLCRRNVKICCFWNWKLNLCENGQRAESEIDCTVDVNVFGFVAIEWSNRIG